jgi:hypothetical protein
MMDGALHLVQCYGGWCSALWYILVELLLLLQIVSQWGATWNGWLMLLYPTLLGAEFYTHMMAFQVGGGKAGEFWQGQGEGLPVLSAMLDCHCF